jgi:hypothetical protein
MSMCLDSDSSEPALCSRRTSNWFVLRSGLEIPRNQSVSKHICIVLLLGWQMPEFTTDHLQNPFLTASAISTLYGLRVKGAHDHRDEYE